MTVRLNEAAFDHAKTLIMNEEGVLDEREFRREHRPSVDQETLLAEAHGYPEYARWRHTFPYGDLARAHRCGVIAADSRAAQQKYSDVERAAAHLHGMLGALQ
ncbi:MAG TPA: hypothetical protein VHV31_07910 [Nitrolancea sp.]|jgi:hypothetical protein|nr:hypothetical protein [Nitrolancea sp.]